MSSFSRLLPAVAVAASLFSLSVLRAVAGPPRGVAAASAGPLRAEYLGRGSISGEAVDLSGDQRVLQDGSPANRLGGIGSGIAWMGGSRYLMIADRGPRDGATEYRCRFHEFGIEVDAATKSVSPKLLATHLLIDGDRPLIGASNALPSGRGPRRFDPEAIRYDSRRKIVYIAEEYGPAIERFSLSGEFQGALTLPRTTIANPSADPDQELPPRNLSGRAPNRGIEGLALSGDGTRLYALLQGPLLQDQAFDAEGKRHGHFARLFELSAETGRVLREFVYPLDAPSLVLSEVEWFAPDRLLVLERDGKPGLPDQGGKKSIVEIDLRGASDIRTVDSLPARELPESIRPVGKRVLIDLLAPEHGLAGEEFPEKIEGLALGPALPGGRRLLLVASDNDFRAEQPSWFFAFAVGE